ncbi:MAG TPA: hypothetical protein VFA76_05285 [Terriglobales bacterium]|jgi:hypothetical protein|nr:hypothetical protein [Terriglobales bacterium]
MKKAAKILGALLIVLASVSLFHEFHGVGDSVTGGTLLWNSQEAYLFVGWGRAGYHFTGFEYVWSHIPAYFGVPRTVDDNCLSTIVVRIAPDGIQRVVRSLTRISRDFSHTFRTTAKSMHTTKDLFGSGPERDLNRLVPKSKGN